MLTRAPHIRDGEDALGRGKNQRRRRARRLPITSDNRGTGVEVEQKHKQKFLRIFLDYSCTDHQHRQASLARKCPLIPIRSHLQMSLHPASCSVKRSPPSLHPLHSSPWSSQAIAIARIHARAIQHPSKKHPATQPGSWIRSPSRPAVAYPASIPSHPPSIPCR